MKKLLTILLALSCAACVLMFAACGTEEEPSDGSDANTTVSDGDAAEITTEGETPDVTTSPEGGSEEPVTTPSSDDTQNGTTATAPTEPSAPESTDAPDDDDTPVTTTTAEPDNEEEKTTTIAPEEPETPETGSQIEEGDDEDVADLGWEEINVDEFLAGLGIDIDDLEVDD